MRRNLFDTDFMVPYYAAANPCRRPPTISPSSIQLSDAKKDGSHAKVGFPYIAKYKCITHVYLFVKNTHLAVPFSNRMNRLDNYGTSSKSD